MINIFLNLQIMYNIFYVFQKVQNTCHVSSYKCSKFATLHVTSSIQALIWVAVRKSRHVSALFAEIEYIIDNQHFYPFLFTFFQSATFFTCFSFLSITEVIYSPFRKSVVARYFSLTGS